MAIMAAEPTTRTAPHVVALVLTAKLGDAADHHSVHTQNPADFGGGLGVRTVAIGEILLPNDFGEGLALDHLEGPSWTSLVTIMSAIPLPTS